MAKFTKNIIEVSTELENGDVVAIPTETVYGLAANAFDYNAVNKIYAVKNRPKNNPLILHIGENDSISNYCINIPEIAHHLTAIFWPGPLTLLLEKNLTVPDFITAKSTYVAIRKPSNSLTLKLLDHINFPLVAPSANPYTYISPTSALHVEEQIGNKINLILDGGNCEKGIESTIIGFEGDDIIIHRLGMITQEEIANNIPSHINIKISTNKKINTPGKAKKHYSPNTPLLLFSNENELPKEGKYIVVHYSKLKKKWDNSYKIELKNAAKNLY